MTFPSTLTTLARLLARRLILAVLFTLSRTSIDTKKTREAATVVPSTPSNTHYLLVLLAQAPLPSILEPRDLPRFLSVLSGSSGFFSRPSLHPWEQLCDRPTNLYHGHSDEKGQSKASVNNKPQGISAFAMVERPLLRSRWRTDDPATFPGLLLRYHDMISCRIRNN